MASLDFPDGDNGQPSEDKTRWTVFCKSFLRDELAPISLLQAETTALLDAVSALIDGDNRDADVSILKVNRGWLLVSCDESFATKIRALPEAGGVDSVKTGYLQAPVISAPDNKAREMRFSKTFKPK